MDFNLDGFLDVVSGCYSRNEGGMAGLFYVLRGRENRTFELPEVLTNREGKPLILQNAQREDSSVDRICTRPTVVDLDGDGNLDIVAGNFRGNFGWFRGEGKGRFASVNTWLASEDGAPLTVDAHSDPCFADWDADGDLDMLSGSASGGVVLFENRGKKNAPSFAKGVQLIEGPKAVPVGRRYGDAHLTGPQTDTRVHADDVDGDGKADLLVGDTAELWYLGDGVTPAEAESRYSVWEKKLDTLIETLGRDAKKKDEYMAAYGKLVEERDVFLREERTGFVWLYRRK